MREGVTEHEEHEFKMETLKQCRADYSDSLGKALFLLRRKSYHQKNGFKCITGYPSFSFVLYMHKPHQINRNTLLSTAETWEFLPFLYIIEFYIIFQKRKPHPQWNLSIKCQNTSMQIFLLYFRDSLTKAVLVYKRREKDKPIFYDEKDSRSDLAPAHIAFLTVSRGDNLRAVCKASCFLRSYYSNSIMSI